MGFKVKYYGVRGSTPVSGKEYLKYGGNTTCIHIERDNTNIIIDAGTGIRVLGNDLLNNGFTAAGGKAHIFFSHTHWDHIQGFPFFVPIYMPQNRFHIYGQTKDIPMHDNDTEKTWTIGDVLEMQQNFMYFPVSTKDLASHIEYHEVTPGKDIVVDDLIVNTIMLRHPNSSIGFRFDCHGKRFVFCTDIEHSDGLFDAMVEFAKDADVLAFDCQYTPEEYADSKVGWGHSTYKAAIEIVKAANVKNLHMIHHDPGHTDSKLEEIESRAKKDFENAFMVPEGHSFSLYND